MKGTKATFPKRPRTHEGMVLGTIMRHRTTCEGESTARGRKRTNLRNRRMNDGSFGSACCRSVGRESKKHTNEERKRENGATDARIS